MVDRDKESVAKAKAYFSPMYGRELTDDEAIEIVENLKAFAVLLIEIYEKEQIKLKRTCSTQS